MAAASMGGYDITYDEMGNVISSTATPMPTPTPAPPIEKPTHNDDLGLPDLHYNPLQNYRNVTYNTRLTMMTVEESAKNRHDRSYDCKKGIVMWETGGTGTVFLEELTITTIGSGSATASYATQDAHQFQGKIVEPLGGRFIESISLAAQQLGYNNNDAVFLLEIAFKGHDANDQPVTCKGWQEEDMVFRWYVRINTLKMSLNYQGSTYEFDLQADIGAANLTDYFTLEQGFSMSGSPSTIGDFCAQLAKELNKREAKKVKSKIRCHPHHYVITAHKDIAHLKYDHAPVSDRSPQWGMKKGDTQATAGKTIQAFILDSVSNSTAFMKHLHRIPEKKDFNSPDTKNDTIHLPIRAPSIICGAKGIEKNNKPQFDNKLGGVVQEVHYFLTSKEDAKNIISAVEYEDATDPAQRDKRVDNWIKLGLLRKVYKWIYTGENAEVINADIKIDNLWRNVRPLWIDSESGQPVATNATQKTKQEKRAAKKASKPTACNEAKKVIPAEYSGKTQFYAEDMPDRTDKTNPDISPKPGWYPHMPKYYHMNTAVDQNSQQAGIYQESATEYSVFRQVGNTQATGGTDMFTMNLEVVGDPYWLFQIPASPGTPPWEEDVWEYEKSHLTEEQLSEKRKNTATHNWLPFIYFEAISPSADWTSTDLINLRKSDAITGIFAAKKVINTFSKGKFTTKLELIRDPLSNPWGGTKSAKTDKSKAKGKASHKGPSNAAPTYPAYSNMAAKEPAVVAPAPEVHTPSPATVAPAAAALPPVAGPTTGVSAESARQAVRAKMGLPANAGSTVLPGVSNSGRG